MRAHSNPRADAAWTIIDVLPAYPVFTVPVAVAATKRTKPAVTNAVVELEKAGILRRLSESLRNRAWEAEGLPDLIAGLDAGAEYTSSSVIASPLLMVVVAVIVIVEIIIT